MRSTDFADVFKVATAGMRVQGDRLRIIAENIAHADSTAPSPGAEPHRRRQLVLKEVPDKMSHHWSKALICAKHNAAMKQT